jgi:transposase
MVIVGADVHKRTHTFVAVDANGRKLGEKTVDTTSTGHRKALNWVRLHFGADVVWGIEDVRQFSGRLERDLLAAGQRVVRVPPNLTARSRAVSRSPGKSDPIDALAVARAVLREPDLPMACHDEVSREFQLLVDRREDLVAQRTSTINRLSGRVHELDPSRAAKPLRLNYANHRQALGDWLATQPGLVAELASDELAEVARLTEAINLLGVRIGERVCAVAPSLLAVPGCGALTAAKLVGETADITRFKSEAAYARYTGVAPVPSWSGSTSGQVRMTRSGNRQLNVALHTIALTQLRLGGLGAAYYRKRIAEGDSPGRALRCLKRRLCRVVFRCLYNDHNIREPTTALQGNGSIGARRRASSYPEVVTSRRDRPPRRLHPGKPVATA